MEGKKESDKGHDSGGDSTVVSATSGGNARTTPPAQRFASLGDAHLAITHARRLITVEEGITAAISTSHQQNDMPSSSSDFNPALTREENNDNEEPEETTVDRIVGEYLPSTSVDAPVSDTASNRQVVDSSSGFNPALEADAAASFRYINWIEPSSTLSSEPPGRDGAVARLGFRPDIIPSGSSDNVVSSADALPVPEAGPSSSERRPPLRRTRPLALLDPPDFSLPSLPPDADRTAVGHYNESDTNEPSFDSIINSRDILRISQYNAHEAQPGALFDDTQRNANVGFDGLSFDESSGVLHNPENSLNVPPLNLAGANAANITSPSAGSGRSDAFSEHPFGRSLSADQNSGSAMSGEDSYHEPFEFDNAPWDCFLRESNEMTVSRSLHQEASDTVSNFSNVLQDSPSRHGRATRGGSIPIPPLPPIPAGTPLDTRPPADIRQQQFVTPSHQPNSGQVRVPIFGLQRSSQVRREAIQYIREQTSLREEEAQGSIAVGSNTIGSDDWVTEGTTTAGFSSNRAFASTDLRSPLERIGHRAGSSIANISDDNGWNDDFELPIGGLHDNSSTEQILSPVPRAVVRPNLLGLNRRGGATAREPIFTPQTRLHRVNGMFQTSARGLRITTPRDSGPYGAASRAINSGLSGSPFAHLQRSPRYEFHDEDDNDDEEELVAGPSNPSRMVQNNQQDDDHWSDISLQTDPHSQAVNTLPRQRQRQQNDEPAPILLECGLISRRDFARRQAVRRASGEEDQTFLDRTGRKLSNPSSVIVRTRHQAVQNQNPFDQASSPVLSPSNAAHRTSSLELEPLTRQGHRQYPSQIQALPLPTMVPLEERRRQFNPEAAHRASANSAAASPSDWALGRKKTWVIFMTTGAAIVPFFWTLVYTRIHDSSLSWFTSGEITRLSATERVLLGVCGVVNLLVWVVIAGVLALLAHNGVIH